MASLPPQCDIPIKDKGTELSIASAIIYDMPVTGKYGKIKKIQMIVFTIWFEA